MRAKRTPYDWRIAEHNAVVPPVVYRGRKAHVSVTYGAPNAATLARRFSGEEHGYIYMGMGEGNPTVREFERAIVATETSMVDEYDAYACASGSSAIHLLTEYLLKKKRRADGTWESGHANVVSSAYVYGGTYYFFESYLPGIDLNCRFVERPEVREEWVRHIDAQTKFLFLETPTNPHGNVYDIAMVASVAHERGLPLVVDNTVATGALQHPLDLGADVVLLSTTKGVNGHSTSGGGVVIGKKEFIRAFRASVQCLRPVLDPHAAIDMLKGLSDLPRRMARHSANALRLATMLGKHLLVERVYYAALSDHPAHALAAMQMRGGGPLFSFTLRSPDKTSRSGAWPTGSGPASLEESQRFIDMLTEDGLIPLAVHIAHRRTLATHPASTSHAKVPKPSREQIGITDNMIRVSVGSERPREFRKVIRRFKDTLDAWAPASP